MLRRMRTKTGRRLYTAVSMSALLIATVGWALYTGFAADLGIALLGSLSPDGGVAGPPIYNGPESLEERILEADVVARVRLRSVSQSVEREVEAHTDDDGEWQDSYINALELRFEVLEYLKGSGGSEVVGITHGRMPYLTELGARL